MPTKSLAAVFVANLKMLVGGETVNSVARRWRIPQKTLDALVRGDRKDPKLSTVEAVAAAVGYKPWQLIADRLDPARPPTLNSIDAVVASNEQEIALMQHFRSLDGAGQEALLLTLRIGTPSTHKPTATSGEVPAERRKSPERRGGGKAA